MSVRFLIPTNQQLRPPIQNYVQSVEGFLGLTLLPLAESWAQFIETEVEDDDEGMTSPHVLGTDVKNDERPGSKKFRYEPLNFKQKDTLNEADILRARRLGTYGQPIDLVTEVTKIAKRRAQKTRVRMEYCIWQALGGRLQFNENNVKVDETFNVQSHSPLALWSNTSTSTPMTDLDTALDKFDGTGASREGAQIIASSETWRMAMKNQNDADLKALDKSNWADFRFLFTKLAQIMTDKTRGAEIVSYDKGYKVAGVHTKFLQPGEIRIVGKRDDGLPIGNFWSTPSLHNMKNGVEQPGYFVVVEVNGNPSLGSYTELGQSSNPRIDVTGGIYGGPNIDFEDNAIKMQVS